MNVANKAANTITKIRIEPTLKKEAKLNLLPTSNDTESIAMFLSSETLT